MEITARNTRKSTCTDFAGALDVDVTVDGVEGEVTLAPCQHDATLAVYGSSPDQWMTGALLAHLRHLDDAAYHAACVAIAAAAVEVAP